MREKLSLKEKIIELNNKLAPFKNVSFEEVERLIGFAENVGKSWSNSWLGYQSRVYYRDFQVPKPGESFSIEWGMSMKGGEYLGLGNMTTGDWCEYIFDDVVNFINQKGNRVEIEKARTSSKSAEDAFEDTKHSVLSIISANFDSEEEDEYLTKTLNEIKSTKASQKDEFIEYIKPSGQITSRDRRALDGGIKVPPHLFVWSDTMEIMAPFKRCKSLRKLISQLASHIDNLANSMKRMKKTGKNIFIGHGQSSSWRELKDFITERLELSVEEFNREPIGGLTNVERISRMLKQSCIALLVMTSEDEQKDGTFNPRLNVVHEAGLFQGRLGFNRAIILLEDDCQAFSNIDGLGQIRFKKGNIKSTFEDIRRILERENIIKL